MIYVKISPFRKLCFRVFLSWWLIPVAAVGAPIEYLMFGSIDFLEETIELFWCGRAKYYDC